MSSATSPDRSGMKMYLFNSTPLFKNTPRLTCHSLDYIFPAVCYEKGNVKCHLSVFDGNTIASTRLLSIFFVFLQQMYNETKGKKRLFNQSLGLNKVLRARPSKHSHRKAFQSHFGSSRSDAAPHKQSAGILQPKSSLSVPHLYINPQHW